ncbi:MAG: hypothetical protein Kow00108_18930 [Calditrichia bacterium]
MIKSEIIKEKDLIVHTSTGEITLDEIKNIIEDFYAQKQLPALNVIWDFTKAVYQNPDVQKIRDLAERINQMSHSRQGGKTAVVVASDLYYGLGRIYQAHSENYNQIAPVMIFRSLQDATSWIVQS